MYRDNEQLVVSATDLVGYLSCPHYTTMSLAALGGPKRAAGPADPGAPDEQTDLDVVQRRGLEHEAAYLARLKAEGLTVFEIDSTAELSKAQAATVEAMLRGDDIVFQGTFFEEAAAQRPGAQQPAGERPGAQQPAAALAWRGHADFLRRVEAPGGTSYEPEDTKLARHVKPSALLQLCMYAEQLERVQGTAPKEIHVVLGGMERVSFVTADLAAYYRRAKSRFVAAATVPVGETFPTPVEHCAVCRFAPTCDERRAADDHLSLVARLTGEQARKLVDHGVDTVAALAASSDSLRVRGIGDQTLVRLRRQARLQVQHRSQPDGPPPFELLELSGQDSGLEALPEPNPGDLFFDIEGDPYVENGGLEYLLGVGWIENGQFQFRSFWAHTRAEEKRAFQAFMDFVAERRRAFPDLHIYHYAPYEPTALGKLAGRHGTREDEVDQLLRGRVLVDLYRVVVQSVAVGSASYSIKKLEPLYMKAREAAVVDAGSSIVEYERWLQNANPQILQDIEHYNREDCESTWLLRDWLEQRRLDAAEQCGTELQRASAADDSASDGVAARSADLEALTDRLLAGIVDVPDPSDAESYGRWLLAQLLEWHRREAKPEWWMYFHRVFECTDEDLIEDSESIGGLTYEGEVGVVKQSVIHRYRFNPDQDHKLSTGSSVADPASERRALQDGGSAGSPGEVLDVDATQGTIDLKRGKNSTVAHPTALIPAGPIGTDPLRSSLERVASGVADHGLDGDGGGRAIRDLLLRRPPRISGVQSGAALVDRSADLGTLEVASRLARGLDHSYLPIQGPPGCGKTFTAARVILDLVEAGFRVGITASGHAVITNLVDAVLSAAGERRTRPRILQKGDDHQTSNDPSVTSTKNNDVVVDALTSGDVDIVAGTQWLFARADLAGTLDYLVIDEAGQLSLANVVAVSPSASNLILVGDPQQLAQPSKGSHPEGAEQSGLDYVLQGEGTIPDDRGLFLGSTYRMHPLVCEFISELAYDGRLRSKEGRERQSVGAGPLVAGSGVRWFPVEHQGNRTSSAEEAGVVKELYDQLLGRDWTDKEDVTRPMTAEDILIVAPYNAQVNLLAVKLGPGARVGTVDKFQGREGAVVIVSMTASSAEDVPRGMEFLYSRNRLNVAVSRARAMSIVVGSPALLSARCRTVKQMHLANGLCRYVELALEQAIAQPAG